MTHVRHGSLTAVLLLLSVACCGPSLSSGNATGTEGTETGPAVDATGSAGSDSREGPTAGGAGPQSGSESGGGGSTHSDDGGSGVGTSTEDGAGFVAEPDGGSEPLCSFWVEDCPEGYKCMPASDDGGSHWNTTKCVSLAPDPKAVDEPCTVEGMRASGVDDCGLHSMCWTSDENGQGVCLAMCIGSPDEPSCAAEGVQCQIPGSGIPAICVHPCDPLIQDCPE